MRRRDFLKQTAWAAAAAGGMPWAAGAASQRPPNIVFMLIDDLGWADVGCYGSTFHETPHIDRLCAQGMKFTDAYAACPVCSPTRASIMTGKYPARLNLTNYLVGTRSPDDSPIRIPEYVHELPLEETTIAEALKPAGYTSAHVGKWHLGEKGYWPEDQGFDVNIGGAMSGMPKSFFWPQWKGNPPIEGRADGEYLVDRLADESCVFIDANRDRPFFLCHSNYAVHIPIEGEADKVAKYEAKLKSHPPPDGAQANPHYAAMVESVDDGVGQILAKLDEHGLTDNTIVVFFSDNGGLHVQEGKRTPATTNAPLRAGKGYLYEGGIRESCIVRWPGVTAPGSVCDEPVCSIDFLPTFCEAAGVPLPDTELDGVTIAPLLRDAEAGLDREALYWHYPHFSNQGGSPGAAIRKGAWKLIERYEFGDIELYNLANDLGETTNIAERHADIARELYGDLAQWRQQVSANMPTPNPKYIQDTSRETDS